MTEETAVAEREHEPLVSRRERANAAVRRHVVWALGGGFVPLPLFDIVAVTAIQVDMLRSLSRIYGADFHRERVKTLVSALTGSTFARLGASAIKAIPGVGTLLGGVSMSAMSGASTFAVGQVAIQHLEKDGSGMFHIDLEKAKKVYEEALEIGKEVVSELKMKGEARDVFEKVRRLGELHQEGALTDEEFEAKKRELLSRL